jgi:hypothetical protein
MSVLSRKSRFSPPEKGHNACECASHGRVSRQILGAAVKKAITVAAFDETR